MHDVGFEIKGRYMGLNAVHLRFLKTSAAAYTGTLQVRCLTIVDSQANFNLEV